ncbi:class I SAM-dependent methyltransferase [Bdellovibrio sp. HCB209]|uniref:class I SAM-dependent methyltransferase n=1 Tax=Bdellovibrio sp. HCB209 TaxID=3394354 RepID=UPI0039B364B5
MKAQYQTFINNNETQSVQTFNNIMALNGLCERDSVRHLQVVVQEMFPQTIGLVALDLGAGRGVNAMALAELGFNVVAYDMYRNSVAVLQRIALQQDLNISFGMGGILHLESLNKKFDMIHDSECLTNTITATDRARFLEGVKKSLEAGGKFVLTAAVQSEQYIPEESFESIRLDADHVLWRETPACDIHGVVEYDDKFWVAQKRVMPAQVLRQELKNAGFDIITEEIEVRADAPALMRLVLTSAQGC